MIIATQDELNEVLARWGCCQFPLFPEPRKECRSIYGSVQSLGYFEPLEIPDPEYDEEGNLIPQEPKPKPPWSIHRRYFRDESNSFSGVDKAYFPGESAPDGQTYDAVTWSGKFSRTYGAEYERGFIGDVLDGNSCPEIPNKAELICTYSGEWAIRRVTWGVHSMDGDNVRFLSESIDETLEVEEMSGKPDPAWQEWKNESDAWDLAHPAFEEEVAAYNEALANYNDVELPAFEADYASWVENGEIGDPPEPPEQPDEPEPRPEEPPKVYPPCTFKFKYKTVTRTFIGNADEPVVEAEGSPLVEETEEIRNNPSLGLSPVPIKPTDTYETSFKEVYESPLPYETWKSSAVTELESLMKFPEVENKETTCPLGSECVSVLSWIKPEYGNTASIASVLADYRFGIPDTENYAGYKDAHAAWKVAREEWSKKPPADRGPEPIEPVKFSYYELQWVEAFFPLAWTTWRSEKDTYDAAVQAKKDWDADTSEDKGPAPEVPPDPGAEPARPRVTQERSWIWEGDMEATFSPRYVIPLPTGEQGETRIVNLMAKGIRSKTLGGKPRAFGEMFDFE